MISTTELRSLTEAEEAQYELADGFITEKVTESFNADIARQTFNISRQALNERVEGLRAKVRQKIVTEYCKNGWKAEFKPLHLVLTMKKRGGRRKKSEIEAEAAAAVVDDQFTD